MRALLASLIALSTSVMPALAEGLVHYPASIDSKCRGGRAVLYDECGDQFKVLAAATLEAERTGKVLMVVYGAEWCIWCHVFTQYISGETGKFQYNLEGDTFTMFELAVEHDMAGKLRRFAADRFVIAHIENRYSPNGAEVMHKLGAAKLLGGGIPVILTVEGGKVVAALKDEDELPSLSVRRDGTLFPYRGYDRRTLLNELERLEAAAGQES